jgi:hypothetical protein
MTDARPLLSKLSGLPISDIDSIWADVKVNHAKIRACVRHRFPDAEANPVKMGAKVTCTACGGTLGLTDAGYYFDGFVAAGGNPDDVWPNFTRKTP